MYAKKEIDSRIGHLESISPGGADDLFSALRAAVDAFFAPDDTLNHDVAYTIHQVAMDYVNRNIRFENQGLIPPFPTNYPAGYENIGDLFGADGAFDDMMAVEDAPFIAGFLPGEAGEDGGAVLTHVEIENWTARIEAGRGAALAGMKTLSDFCEYGGGLNFGLAQYFENLGQPTHIPENTETARRVYKEIGWEAVIEAFGLEVHIPTYYKGGNDDD